MKCQICKDLSSPQRCDQITHLRAPLDSTPSNLTQSPTNTMRPVKKKTYQDHTFALRIPLELDDDDLDSLKLEHLSWLCLLAHPWWRHLQMLPHTPLWERLAKIRLHVPILSFHFIFFSWYIWWLGDKHECSLKLLFQAMLAICSTNTRSFFIWTLE